MAEMLFHHGGIVHRFLLVGESVEVTAQTFEGVVDVETASAFRPLEAGVLDEMSHAEVGRVFVARSCLNDVAAMDYF